MVSSDISSIFQWWFMIFVLGTGFLPITFILFKNFFDKGYILSKLLAVSSVTYLVFILGVLRILPFNQLFSGIVFFFLVILSIILTPIKKTSLSVLKNNWRIFVFEETLFLAALFFWAYIHSFNPDIHGLEKFMDFGFINSILRAEYFPAKDMWFTPFSINYYYFGHLTTAVLTKLSGLPSSITFNLMLSTVFAFCLVQSFSIGANLYNFMQKNKIVSGVKRALSGVLTATLVTLSGNLHILYSFFKPYEMEKPAPFWELAFSPLTFPNSYWYPNATRFIHNTIHEFPIYSWVVADLHGHVLDIPFVLLTIAVLLTLFIKSKNPSPKPETASNMEATNLNVQNQKNKKGFGKWKMENGKLILIGFLLAVMYMTNAWDGGIYLLLTGLVLLFIRDQSLKNFFISIGVVVFALFLFSFPYNYFFKPFASGIGILCAPEFLTKIGKIGPFLFEKNYCQHSPWWQLLTLYGFFYFFVISFIVFSYKAKKLYRSDIFVFLLIILSTFLIILPEFIYLKDIYPAHYRANTMFKLVFQSFIMLSISAGYIIIRIVSSIKYKVLSIKEKILAICFLILTSSLLALVLTYPYLAVNSYYGLDQKNDKQEPKKPAGLNGITYLQKQYPNDYSAIMWLNKNVSGQPVVLEAQGDSYTDFGRVSSNTGLPTVLGWTVHEWLWRGSYDIPSPRINEIKTIYETSDAETAKKLLKKYKVSYVFIGSLEYQKYPALSDAKFEKIGKVVYRNQNTKIYKVSL